MNNLAYQNHKNQKNGQYKKIKEVINSQRRGKKDPLGQEDYQRQKHQQDATKYAKKDAKKDAKNNSPFRDKIRF